jgi:hypothetical protein
MPEPIPPVNGQNGTLHSTLENLQTEPDKSSPQKWVPLKEEPAFTPAKKLRIVCIGAGFSGMIMAQKVYYDEQYKDLVDFRVYEKNSSVGGTWFANQYPGVAWYDVLLHFVLV